MLGFFQYSFSKYEPVTSSETREGASAVETSASNSGHSFYCEGDDDVQEGGTNDRSNVGCIGSGGRLLDDDATWGHLSLHSLSDNAPNHTLSNDDKEIESGSPHHSCVEQKERSLVPPMFLREEDETTIRIQMAELFGQRESAAELRRIQSVGAATRPEISRKHAVVSRHETRHQNASWDPFACDDTLFALDDTPTKRSSSFHHDSLSRDCGEVVASVFSGKLSPSKSLALTRLLEDTVRIVESADSSAENSVPIPPSPNQDQSPKMPSRRVPVKPRGPKQMPFGYKSKSIQGLFDHLLSSPTRAVHCPSPKTQNSETVAPRRYKSQMALNVRKPPRMSLSLNDLPAIQQSRWSAVSPSGHSRSLVRERFGGPLDGLKRIEIMGKDLQPSTPPRYAEKKARSQSLLLPPSPMSNEFSRAKLSTSCNNIVLGSSSPEAAALTSLIRAQEVKSTAISGIRRVGSDHKSSGSLHNLRRSRHSLLSPMPEHQTLPAAAGKETRNSVWLLGNPATCTFEKDDVEEDSPSQLSFAEISCHDISSAIFNPRPSATRGNTTIRTRSSASAKGKEIADNHGKLITFLTTPVFTEQPSLSDRKMISPPTA